MELVAEGFINRCIGNAPSIFVSICCIVSREHPKVCVNLQTDVR